jgi:hypothetical protein
MEQNSLWTLLTKCLFESIPLFVRGNSLIFYKNGLQQVEISEPAHLPDSIRDLSKKFPLALLKAWVQANPAKSALLDHTQKQIVFFEGENPL